MKSLIISLIIILSGTLSFAKDKKKEMTKRAPSAAIVCEAAVHVLCEGRCADIATATIGLNAGFVRLEGVSGMGVPESIKEYSFQLLSGDWGVKVTAYRGESLEIVGSASSPGEVVNLSLPVRISQPSKSNVAGMLEVKCK